MDSFTISLPLYVRGKQVTYWKLARQKIMGKVKTESGTENQII